MEPDPITAHNWRMREDEEKPLGVSAVDSWEAGKSAGLAEGLHGEGGAGIGFAGGGHTVVAGDVVEVVAGDEEAGHCGAGGQLGGGVGLPVAGGAAVAVGGAHGASAGLAAGPGEGVGTVAGIGQLDADGAGVQELEGAAGLWVFPFAAACVATGAVEGAALDDAAIPLDHDVGRGPIRRRRLPEING